ncbi:MAG: L-type lectin-domain containing protein, partial [Candidatus Acidiferrum sp.]
SGALSPSLFAQGAFSITNFTSSNLCPSPYTASGCVVAINDNAVASGGGALQLTASLGNQVGSAWGVAPETVLNGFTTQFQFQFTNPSNPPADGIAFVIQNVPTTPLGAIGFTGGNGGAIGYGGDDANNDVAAGITNSLAIEFDSYQNGWDPDADHVAVQSCGTSYNTSHHGQNCPTGTSSTLGITAAGALAKLGITITDGNVHTVNIVYNSPGTSCYPLSPANNTNNLCIYMDTVTAPVLAVIADLSTIGLTNGTAYVGFTGATGGSEETQDILNWTFTPASSNTTTTLTPGGSTLSVINSNPATLIEQTITLPLTVSCNGQPETTTCPSITLLTNNVLIPNLGSYVVATPFATAQCFGRLGNPNGSCSLYENACYGGSITLLQADDYYCPYVTQGQSPSNVINLLDTWVPVSQPDPSKTIGTTISLIAFSPSFPRETWMPAPAGQTTPNAVCTNPFGTSTSTPPPPVGMAGGSGCDFVDSLVNVSGDQTTTRGSKPKSKAWLMSASGVYYPPTSVYFNGSVTPVNTPGTYNPSATSGTWYPSAPSLTFTVNPACPYFNTFPCNLSPADQVTYNYFAPAPVAGETYDVITLANQPPANQTPSAYVISPTSATPPDSFSTEKAVPVTFTGSLAGITQDGQYLLEFGASDNVGIGERYIYLTPPTGSCPTPNGTILATGSCYVTTPFQVQLNIDSFKPTINSATLSPGGYPAGTFQAGQTFNVVAACIDKLNNGVASGLAACNGQTFSCVANTLETVTSPTITAPTVAGNYSYSVTAQDCAGNSTTSTVPYTVAPSVTLQLNTIPLINFTTTLPGGVLTFGAAITNQSAAPAVDVTVTTTFTNTSGVFLGTPSATISTVSCSNSPCTLKGTTVTTIKCSVTGSVNAPLIACTVPSLGPVSTKTGLWMEIILPVSSKSPAGTFTSVTTAGSAGITTANSIKESYTVRK